MAVPIDAIRAFHNGFRKDIVAIDSAAYAAARGRDGLSTVLKRFAFFNDMLAWHASGEEAAVFPELESVAPLVAEAYERDHRGLDSLCDLVIQEVNASDALATARATSALNFHLGIHLNKEDAHLYRIFNERVSLPKQWAILGQMAQKVPQERFAEMVGWLYPLIGPDDREKMIRIWLQVMPEPAFIGATKLIQAAIGDDWAELTRRIPELV